MYPNSIEREGSGAADNDVLFVTEEISKCNEHVIHCTAGSIDIEVSTDEGLSTPTRPQTFTDSSTFPIALMLLNATNPSSWVTQIDAGQVGVLTGRFDRVRVRQRGVTAATAHLSSYVR
jgi:hypothetical protein